MQPAFSCFIADDRNSIEDDVGAEFADQETERIGVNVHWRDIHGKRSDNQVVDDFGREEFNDQICTGGGNRERQAFPEGVSVVPFVIAH